MRSLRLLTVFAIACFAVVGSTLVPAAGAGRTLPCIPLDAVDGKCERWSSSHGGTGFDMVEGIVTSPNGAWVFASGYTVTPEGMRALVVAADAATGDQLWSETEGREGDEYDSARSLAVSPDGKRVYLAGAACAITTDGSTCDVLLAARDAATGAKLWSVFRDGQGKDLDSAQGIAVSEDGSVVYIGGQTFSPGRDVDYLVAAFDAETGDELWSSTYDGPAHGFDRGAGLVLAGDTAFVTGRSAGDDPQDMATVAFDTREGHEGEIRWVARYDGPGGSDQATAIDVDAAGERVVIAGESQRSGVIMDPTVVAYDAGNGAQMWSARYDDAGLIGGKIFDVAISPDGESVAMTGFTGRSGAKGPSTLLYAGDTGERRWVANLNSGTNTALDFSPDGRRLYATGSTYTDRRTHMHRTLSYQVSTGQQLWSGLFEETAPPTSLTSTVLFPSGLVVSPDGTDVYVAGLVRPWLAEQDDALVLAYTA